MDQNFHATAGPLTPQLAAVDGGQEGEETELQGTVAESFNDFDQALAGAGDIELIEVQLDLGRQIAQHVFRSGKGVLGGQPVDDGHYLDST
jgi:hypothetical protein